jgi:hypothetical protein
MITLLVMASLLRVSYELTQPEKPVSPSVQLLPQAIADGRKEPELTPQQRQWAERAVQRYAEAQEKKWRRWNEAMFETENR